MIDILDEIFSPTAML